MSKLLSEQIDGLLIKKEFVNLILAGAKNQENRNYSLPRDKINIAIYVLSEGRVWAKIRFNVDSIDNKGLHTWGFSVIQTYPEGKLYFHPNGAQRWVKNVKLRNGL